MKNFIRYLFMIIALLTTQNLAAMHARENKEAKTAHKNAFEIAMVKRVLSKAAAVGEPALKQAVTTQYAAASLFEDRKHIADFLMNSPEYSKYLPECSRCEAYFPGNKSKPEHEHESKKKSEGKKDLLPVIPT